MVAVMALLVERQYELPITKCRVVAVGGFHAEMAPEQLKEVMERAYTQAGDSAMDWLQEVEAPYKLGTMIKLIMKNSKAMWSLLKTMTGKKFQYAQGGKTTQLWHGIDKSPSERLVSKKLGRAAQAVRTYLATHGIEDKYVVRIDSTKGMVFTCVPSRRVRRVFTLASDEDLQVESNYIPDDVLGFPAEQFLDEINLG